MWALPWCALAFIATVGLCACGGASGSIEVSSPRGSLRDFGSPATGAQAQRAEAVLRAYFAALVSSEWSRACSYLAAPVRRVRARFAQAKHKGNTCASGLRVSSEALRASHPTVFAEPEVSSVRTEGKRGFIFCSGGAGSSESVMPIRSKSGVWKLAPLGPVGVPVASE
jgi:hypothetical protein